MRRVHIHTKATLLGRWFTVSLSGAALPRGLCAFSMRDSAETIETIAEAYVNMDLRTMQTFHELVLKQNARRTPGAAPLPYEEVLLKGMGGGNSGGIGATVAAPTPANNPKQNEASASDNSAAQAKKAAEKNIFDVALKKYPSANKVKLIKELRAVSALPLQEAKAAVEKCPGVVLKAMAKADAEKLKALFEGHGAEVELL